MSTSDTLFEHTISTATNNHGVDAVLNASSNKLLEASLGCLAPGGALLQIEESELENNNLLNIYLLRKEVTFYGLIPNRIFEESKDVKEEIHKIVENGIKIGFVRPLPKVVFAFEDMDKAIDSSVDQKVIGKVLVNLRNEDYKVSRPLSVAVWYFFLFPY